MQIELLYGRSNLSVRLPTAAQVTVIRKPAMPLVADANQAVQEAFQQPVGTESLTQLASQASTACIAICDITRPVPNHLFLRPMIEALQSAGIQPDKITVLVATGLHRPNLGDELSELVGDPWVLENVRVENHDARRDDQHVVLGRTSTRETVVRLDRRFVTADLRIATGLVEPHFMAGYSGGRKVIAPGLAHSETIRTFHSARFMADPATRNCNLRNNPLHEEQLEIIEMLGGALAVNTVIDENRRLSFINFGEIVSSHQQAVDFVRPYCEVPLQQRFHTVVTSSAGYPLDKTFYQTVKGMVGAMNILEPGGDLIIVSECSEGLGSKEFRTAQQRMVALGADRFLIDLLKKSHADVDEWQTQMQLKPQAIGNIHLFAPLLEGNQHLTGVQFITSVEQAIQASLQRHADSCVAVIPEGPYVVPYFDPQPLLSTAQPSQQ